MELSLIYGLFVAVCLVLSFFFSGMETGVFALSRLRIRQQVRAGRRAAIVLQQHLDHPEKFLWTILIGNSLATFSALGLALAAWYESMQGRAGLFLLGLLVFTLFLYTVCDLLPKTLFRQFPNRLCLMLALPYHAVHLILVPVVALVTGVSYLLIRLTGRRPVTAFESGSRNELKWVMQESAHGLTTEERSIIERVLNFQSVCVRQIMTPIDRVIAVESHTTVRQLLELGRIHGVTRMPVWQTVSGRRRIVGLVSTRALHYETELPLDAPAESQMKGALYLREDVPLEPALRRLQRSGHRLAIVLGLDQRELGIVTLQDIIRALFGEISL